MIRVTGVKRVNASVTGEIAADVLWQRNWMIPDGLAMR